MTHYESLAIDYANQALVLRAVATVHLENMNDEFFWKPILESQRLDRQQPEPEGVGKIEDWRNRPHSGEYPYVFVDGIYLKRSWGGVFGMQHE